jgi:hypothetical protein
LSGTRPLCFGLFQTVVDDLSFQWQSVDAFSNSGHPCLNPYVGTIGAEDFVGN